MSRAAPGVPEGLAALGPLFGEINDLKRVRQDGDSVAGRAFAASWAALAAGEAPDYVALREAARAVAAVVLGPVDAAVLADGGLSAAETTAVLEGAIADRAGAVDPVLPDRLRAGARALAAGGAGEAEPPGFVARLAATPRAGATCPGKPRLVAEPAESHAEHCWTVAVYGALIHLRGDPGGPETLGTTFLAGLAHHLHNAWLPDAGFAGEVALGAHLDTLVATFRARALGELAPPLRGTVGAALAGKDEIATPAGAAFTAADALDRVLQMAHYEARAAFRLSTALEEMELVHEGPLKAFQDGALRAAGVTA